jgi:hypothetical protein
MKVRLITASIYIKNRNLILFVFLALTINNIIGIFYYKTINNNNKNIIDYKKRTISEKIFWSNAYKKGNQTIYEYVQNINGLINDRLLLIDPKHTKPTFFENYILYIYSMYLGKYEWYTTAKAIKLGGGFCSQHAFVLNNILREQGINSRILALSGHVVNEVYIENKWYVVDSTYNIIINKSLCELENNSELVYQAYINAGRPEDEAKKWKSIYQSAGNNWHFMSSKIYGLKRYLIEKIALYLVWIIPLVLLIIYMVCLYCESHYSITRKD